MRSVLVQNVQLLRRRVLLQQLGRHLSLRSQHDAVVGQYADRRAGERYRLERILDLVQAAFRREDGCLGSG